MSATRRLWRLTVPGLSIKRDFTHARRRLLAAFPDIQEVLATTAPGTLIVVSAGPEDVEAWLQTLEPLTIPKMPRARGPRRRWGGGPPSDDSAA